MKKRILSVLLAIAMLISCAPFAFALPRGDVDGDGNVNSSDALLVLQYSVGQLSEIDAERADVNYDKSINSSDALIILQISVGMSVETGIKAGFIFLDDENSAYDRNFMQAAENTCLKLGVKCLKKLNISESDECCTAADELVKEGCTFIFADSFGHEDFILKSAKKYPAVQFVCASGTLAHTEKLTNFHNAYASVNEGRYLTGRAAGLKLNEMISEGIFNKSEAKLGFVGSYAAEMISAYTAFYLGAQSVCPTVTMDVQFVGNWHIDELCKSAAEKLIKRGCKLIGMYDCSPAASAVCEKNGIPFVSYNGVMTESCPNTALISARINWEPYFEYALRAVLGNKTIATDYCGSLKDGSVAIEGLNETVAPTGTKLKLDLVEECLRLGVEHVFDTSAFTVGGEKLKTYMADVDTESNFDGDTEAVSNGYFHESEFRSAPYFDLKIDGINLIVENSPLVNYTNITDDRNSLRNHVIDTITIHCYVGQVTAKEGCDYFATTERQVSANYVVGTDGSIGLSVPECDRAWTSSSRYNDQRAITIEVASDTKSPYAVNSKAYAALINLCADICRRNGIKKLIWKNDKALIGQTDLQNMTVHRWFSNTDCPGDYLMNHMGDIASKANAKL